MRKRVWYILFVFVSALFISCDKDDVADYVSDNIVEDNYFIGTWVNTHSVVYKTDGTGTSWGNPVYPGGSLSYEPRVLYNWAPDFETYGIPYDYSVFRFVLQDNGIAKLQGFMEFAGVYSYDIWGYSINKTGKYTIIENSVDFSDESDIPIMICDEPINIKFDQNDSTLCVSVVDKMLAREVIGSHGVELWGDTAKYTAEIYFKKNYKGRNYSWITW